MIDLLKNLDSWQDMLCSISIKELNPSKTAIISVDMIKGFCSFGALSHPNCGAISSGVSNLFSLAYDSGFKEFILIQDRHDEKSAEFDTFAAHATAFSDEAKTIDEIANLAFFNQMKIFYKNSLSIAYNDEFNGYLAKNSHIDTFVVVGVCTDLCVYSLVSHLALSANEKNIKRDIIIPASLVATYDTPTHNALFYQKFFLHHTSLAFGAKIYKDIIG